MMVLMVSNCGIMLNLTLKLVLISYPKDYNTAILVFKLHKKSARILQRIFSCRSFSKPPFSHEINGSTYLTTMSLFIWSWRAQSSCGVCYFPNYRPNKIRTKESSQLSSSPLSPFLCRQLWDAEDKNKPLSTKRSSVLCISTPLQDRKAGRGSTPF